MNQLLHVKYTLPDNAETKDLTKPLRDKVLHNYNVNVNFVGNNRDSVTLLALGNDAHANVASARGLLDDHFAQS